VSILGLGLVGVFGTASPANAQFMMGGGGFRHQSMMWNSPWMWGGMPWRPPYTYSTSAFQRYNFNIPSPSGNLSFGFSRAYNTTWTGYVNPYRNSYVYPSYPTYYGGYITGGSVPNLAIDNAQANFEKAQREMVLLRNTPVSTKNQIYDQWAYEKLGVQGLVGLVKPGDQPEALQKALAATDETAIANGESLNHIMVAVVALEGKGAKGASAFLAPNLLSDVRFSGSPTAEAMNVILSSSKLEPPVAFETEPLRPHAAAIERDFAGLIAPVLLGKPVDPAKMIKFETTLKQAQDAATPLTRTLPFEDAIALRKFLNQFDAAVKVLRDPNAAGFVNPKWATEGTNVADLVKHMTKYKLLFGKAEPGSEEAYLALHRGLSAYLFALTQNVKK
jgi:hypothetical protein